MGYSWEKNLNFENVIDWIERLEMITNVHNYNDVQLFKIIHLNLKEKAKEWYKDIELAPTYWATLKATMEQRYRAIDSKEIRVKLRVKLDATK
jgi:hypothetical protein